jgi:energy-coupling factor transport system ATP-binding protein
VATCLRPAAGKAGVRKADPRSAALGILDMFALRPLADRHPQSLSGGEKQRLVIACALAKKPDVLILDEPTSGLDGSNMRRIAAALASMADKGACVLVITHDLELMETACTAALRLPPAAIMTFPAPLNG